MMKKQAELFKGEMMEEKLRSYFLDNGYFVLRGVKYIYENEEITDIDLFLYGRISSLSRERMNVDIKNKKSPKAFERILWAKGLQNLLGFDRSGIATTDRKDSVRRFGIEHDITVLDGSFLQKLPSVEGRIFEEELLEQLATFKSFVAYKNKSWKSLYEVSKSRLLNEMDFSGFNSSLYLLKYFLLKRFDHQKQLLAIRVSYLILSHTLIILDYLLKDIAFLESGLRLQSLKDGFKYGNLGLEGVNRTIEMAQKIANSNVSTSEIRRSMEAPEILVLAEFFSKVENSKNVFKWAINFEKMGFESQLVHPNALESSMKGVLAVLVDHFGIDRGKFFSEKDI